MATLSKPNGAATGTYTFASQPRAVASQRNSGKYREPAEALKPQTYGNMMFDPRVIRGNTYRLQQTTTSSIPDPLELQRQQESFRRTQQKKRADEKSRVRTPDAVAGRQNTEVQTELYLEELTDRVEETEVETQTDAFLDRPPSPMFIPVKSGIDATTEILPGELFDFDREVRPLLEVLVGKTLEQAMMEVMEEEELARLRRHQDEFEELRNSELVETQRREEMARRAREEKDRRVRQAREALVKEKETSEKVAARAFAKNYMASIVPNVFDSLSRAGYFYDQQEREIELDFVPWLLDEVESRITRSQRARALLDEMLASVVQARAAAYRKLDPRPETPPVEAEPAPAPAPVPAVVEPVPEPTIPVVVEPTSANAPTLPTIAEVPQPPAESAPAEGSGDGSTVAPADPPPQPEGEAPTTDGAPQVDGDAVVPEASNDAPIVEEPAVVDAPAVEEPTVEEPAAEAPSDEAPPVVEAPVVSEGGNGADGGEGAADDAPAAE